MTVEESQAVTVEESQAVTVEEPGVFRTTISVALSARISISVNSGNEEGRASNPAWVVTMIVFTILNGLDG